MKIKTWTQRLETKHHLTRICFKAARKFKLTCKENTRCFREASECGSRWTSAEDERNGIVPLVQHEGAGVDEVSDWWRAASTSASWHFNTESCLYTSSADDRTNVLMNNEVEHLLLNYLNWSLIKASGYYIDPSRWSQMLILICLSVNIKPALYMQFIAFAKRLD